ncbi:MAG: hypothetical protein KF823_06365 [Xanthomonadales bacterium]|nr:hypothetical protein [Xanthomonadales bacterium]
MTGAASTLAGNPPTLRVEAFPREDRLSPGQPLIVDLRVENRSSADLAQVLVASGSFTLTSGVGATGIGCTLEISTTTPLPPLPPRPPLFAFTWQAGPLAAGESANCTAHLPGTLHPGTETIGMASLAAGVLQQHPGFSYVIVAPPLPVPGPTAPFLPLLALAMLAAALAAFARPRSG